MKKILGLFMLFASVLVLGACSSQSNAAVNEAVQQSVKNAGTTVNTLQGNWFEVDREDSGEYVDLDVNSSNNYTIADLTVFEINDFNNKVALVDVLNGTIYGNGTVRYFVLEGDVLTWYDSSNDPIGYSVKEGSETFKNLFEQLSEDDKADYNELK
ncbi:TPA: hypothetical protein U1022_000657 [Streptococcus suis]|nr:hypothetical protein [Streptococcus suis]HEM4919948.1 hypothetical protein [Streptococcus suis]